VVKLRNGIRIDVTNGQTVTGANYAIKKKKGDYSLNDIFGYKRVFLSTGEPLRIPDKNTGNMQSVYKLVNLYGDGARASEYYTDFKKSVIDNGTIQIEEELNDADIVRFYGGEIVKEDVSLPEEEEVTEVEYTAEEQLEFEINDLTQRIEELEYIQKDLDVTNVETIVLNNLPKITPVSAKKETGAKVGTKLDISPSLLNVNGVTVDQAAHNIWENNQNLDIQEVRDIIIDILSSGSKSNYASQIGTSSELIQLKEQLRDSKNKLSSLEKGKPKVKIVTPIPGQLNLFEKEEDSWKDEDNDDTCVPF
jgi:hypothetical protein